MNIHGRIDQLEFQGSKYFNLEVQVSNYLNGQLSVELVEPETGEYIVASVNLVESEGAVAPPGFFHCRDYGQDLGVADLLEQFQIARKVSKVSIGMAEGFLMEMCHPPFVDTEPIVFTSHPPRQASNRIHPKKKGVDMSTKIPATIRGNLTADPEYGFTDNGKPWANFTVAVNSRFFNEEINDWDTAATEFHKVRATGSLAENLQRSGLSKGHPIIAEGRFSFGEYTKTIEGKEYTFQTRTFEAQSVGPDLVKTAIAFPSPRSDGPVFSSTVITPADVGHTSPSIN